MSLDKPSDTAPKPNVLVHITTVPASLFGFLSGQLRFMRSHGLDVNVISSPGELLDAFAAQEGVRSHDVDMTRRITPFADLVALAHLCMAMRRIRPHIVHAHSPKGGLLGMLAAFITRVPVRIYHIRGLPFMTARGLRRYVLVTAERVSCRLAVEVLCVSESMRRVAVENRICKPHKLKVFLLYWLIVKMHSTKAGCRPWEWIPVQINY